MDKVNIRPGVTILSVLKHLNYKPYYALAEFVDNSLDSFLKNKERILNLEGNDFQLTVDIELNTRDNIITVRDNAAGISKDEFPRAFRAAEVPADSTMLSEFGMGMKSASCWFSNKWEVRTSSLGDPVERTVSFDIEKIVNGGLDELSVTTKNVRKNSHYTVVTLFEVEDKMPIKKAMGKVKRHLGSIYRDFVRKNVLKLNLNKSPLEYETPEILNAPFYDDASGKTIEWKRDIEGFEFGDDGKGGKLRVSGFVAIMETMQAHRSGFALFRRGRVIEGSADRDEGFRPARILGSVGSHRYKRLFGELHLEGFQVSHTKDGFQWDDNMEVFLDLLKETLEEKGEIPLLKQADKYRVRSSKKSYEQVSKTIVNNTVDAIGSGLASNVETLREPKPNRIDGPLTETTSSYFRSFLLEFDDCDWEVIIELSYDESIDDLIQVGSHIIPQEHKSELRQIGIRLSLIHPFMIEFADDNKNIIEPILRIMVAYGLSETSAILDTSPIQELRMNINELLKGVLSKQ